MPCYHPLPAWYSKRVGESGKRGVVFNVNDGFKDKPVELPCGRCIGCRLERSRQWAVRCVHEAQLWDRNCFITLTYRPEDLPPHGGLVPEHFVLFMKRLRAKHGAGIRFFHCGEYGDELGRPHHHAILFNFDFPDKKVHSRANGVTLYASEELEKLWRFGFCTVGDCTFESAAYIARYSLKKINGAGAEAHYQGRKPEYLTMSRRPGIGKLWLDKYGRDVFPSDEVVIRGVRAKPPKYYGMLLERSNPDLFRKIKAKRKYAAADDPDGTGKRLIVREVVREAAVSSLKRVVEAT